MGPLALHPGSERPEIRTVNDRKSDERLQRVIVRYCGFFQRDSMMRLGSKSDHSIELSEEILEFGAAG